MEGLNNLVDFNGHKKSAQEEQGLTESVGQNSSSDRIVKVVEFKIPKEYFDNVFGEDENDSTNESSDSNMVEESNSTVELQNNSLTTKIG